MNALNRLSASETHTVSPQNNSPESPAARIDTNEAASYARDRFNGQDWSLLFLLLDAALDLPTVSARDALLAQVTQHAPEYGEVLRHLLDVHVRVERTEFLRRGPGLFQP